MLTEWLRFSSVFSSKKLIICQDLPVPKERQQTQVSVQKKDANLGHHADLGEGMGVSAGGRPNLSKEGKGPGTRLQRSYISGPS